MEPIRYTSPSTEAPFTRNAQEISELYFSRSTPERIGAFTVYSESDVGHLITQAMEVFNDENQNAVRDPGEEVYQTYNLVIFISKDASYLQEVMDKTRPDPNDVCIFLEDNSTDTFSGTTAFLSFGGGDIFVGDHVKDSLSSWFDRNEEGSFFDFLALQERFGFSVDLTRKQMKKLIETGEIRDTSMSFAIGIFQVLNGFNILAAPVYKTIGDFILSSTSTLRGFITFQEYHWNPDAQVKNKKTGEMEDNPDFTPFLLPFSHELIDALSEAGAEEVSQVLSKLKESLVNYKGEMSSALKRFSKKSFFKISIPKELMAFMERCADYISSLLDKLLSTCEEIVTYMSSIGKTWLNMINAFYCGLWNSLVEAVLGIVDMVGYLFKGLAIAGETIGNAQTLIPQVLEIADETYQTILNTDLSILFGKSLKAIVEQVMKVDLASLASTLSFEKAANFVGGLVGFAVEIIVGIFWSGGLDSIRATLTKFLTLGDDLFKFISAAATKAMGGAVGFSMDSLIALVQRMLSLLKEGADEIVKMIEELFAALQRGFKSMDEMIRAIMDIFGFHSEDISLVNKMGMEFTGLVSDVCTICKKAE